MTAMASAEVTNLRANLNALCRRHGSIQKIADKAGITRVFLSNFLRGKASPSFETAVDLSKAVGVPLATLIDDPEKIMSRAS